MGFLSFILHAHLPFVRHPEHSERHDEESLYQVITEAYLPLIHIVSDLHKSGLAPRLTISISPALCEMLADRPWQSRYTNHLENLLSFTEQEVKRTAREAPEFVSVARMYDEKLSAAWELWSDQLKHDIPRALRDLQAIGALEIITCTATNAVLPLISTSEARRAQVEIAAANYRKHFGQPPLGIWLPGGAYEPGIETLLADVGIEYFMTDAHAILYGDPRPRYGIYAPVRCPNGVAVFARDPQTTQQVGSSVIGYPSDPAYREFHSDPGVAAPPLEHFRSPLQENSERRPPRLKRHRITNRDLPSADKQPYDPPAAMRQVAIHAEQFIGERTRQIERLRDSFDNRAPLLVAPFPAELFGHWWFEGGQFLDSVFRQLHQQHQQELAAITPGDYLRFDSPIQTQQPSLSSLGAEGYFKDWLNEDNAWMRPQQQAAELRMTKIANEPRQPLNETMHRALNQAARELLLAQSSEWAFQVYQGAMPEYATGRFRSHIHRFHRLADAVERSSIDEDRLAESEQHNQIFAELDYTVFQSKQ